jgi:hypothetical protein
MQCRFASLLVVTMAIFLAVAPAGALAETESTETTTTTESPPPSAGWVPQGGAAEGSGGGSSGAQQGSSLGSGGSSSSPTPKPPAPSSPPPVSSAPPPAPSSGSYETEAAVEPAPEEAVNAPAPEPEAAPAKPTPEPPARVNAHVDLGSADAVLSGSGGVKGVSTSSAAESAASTTAAVDPDSGGLPWLALIVFSLILVVAGARLVFGPIEADSLRYSRFKLVRRAAPRG